MQKSAELLWIFGVNPQNCCGFYEEIRRATVDFWRKSTELLWISVFFAILGPMQIKRAINLPGLLARKSFFLFGPRGVGKTFLARKQLDGRAVFFDLLNSNTFIELSANPANLESLAQGQITGQGEPVCVVIDEIQKLPVLLDEAHRLIENRRWRFLLTGSSARKLGRQGVNLLAGRAWNQHLYPLTWKETPDFDLLRQLRYGSLPPVCLSQEPQEELQAYVANYITQEIQLEGLARKIPQFSKFLRAAALSNGQLLNFDKLGRDYALPPSTIREYYAILQETFIGVMLEPWNKSEKRKAVSAAKFYFFDTGVLSSINGTLGLERDSSAYGNRFETWLINEIKAFVGYHRLHLPVRYWRAQTGHEVDLVAGDEIAVEIKATRKVSQEDKKGLKALREEGIIKQFFLVSEDETAMLQNGIHCLHWADFLKRLWAGEVLQTQQPSLF